MSLVNMRRKGGRRRSKEVHRTRGGGQLARLWSSSSSFPPVTATCGLLREK